MRLRRKHVDFDDTGRALRQAKRLRLWSVLTAMLVVAVFSVGVAHLAQRFFGRAIAEVIEILVVGIALIAVTAPVSAMLRRSIVEMHEIRERWRFDAIRDSLTGLFNRRHFDERLDEEVARTRRHGNALSLIVADVDHFKQVNDQHGHATGDAALREIATRIRGMTRREDVVARIGGDEVGVILPDTPLAHAFEKAQRLRDCVAGEPVVAEPSGAEISVTVSCGVGGVGDDVSDGHGLLRSADQSLYQAKLRRNSVAAVQLEDVADYGAGKKRS